MDGQYEETRRAQNSNFPNLMMNVIDNFLSDGDNSMRELADLLSARSVNYTKVTIAASLIKGGGSSLGGCRVAVAARALLIASNNQDKHWHFLCIHDFRTLITLSSSCETSHERVVNEYYLFRDKLRTLHQMERAITHSESSRRG